MQLCTKDYDLFVERVTASHVAVFVGDFDEEFQHSQRGIWVTV